MTSPCYNYNNDKIKECAELPEYLHGLKAAKSLALC